MSKDLFVRRPLTEAQIEQIKRLAAKAPIHVFHPVEKEMIACQKDCAFAYQMARDLYTAGKYTKDWQRYARRRSEDLRMLRMRLDIHLELDKKHE